MERFVTTTGIAQLAGKSVDGVRYDIRVGKLIPDARTEGGAALFTRETAERWAQTQKRARASNEAA